MAADCRAVTGPTDVTPRRYYAQSGDRVALGQKTETLEPEQEMASWPEPHSGAMRK